MPAIYVRAAFKSHNSVRNQDIVNVLHFEADTLSSPADYTGLATDIANHFKTQYLAFLTSAATFQNVTVTNEDYPSAPVGQGVANVNAAGTRNPVDQKLDPNDCALLSWHTGVPKRYARGWMFCPPALDSSSLMATNLFDPALAYGQAVIAFSGLYTTGFTVGSTSYTPIIFSRSQVKKGLSPYQFRVTGGTWDQKQHWLRKRTTGR